jgi:LPXTG-motif cell wall-anchored protein
MSQNGQATGVFAWANNKTFTNDQENSAAVNLSGFSGPNLAALVPQGSNWMGWAAFAVVGVVAVIILRKKKGR